MNPSPRPPRAVAASRHALRLRGLTLLAALLGATALQARFIPAPMFQDVLPGLAYASVVETNRPWAIHIARLELGRREYRFETTLARAAVVGLAPVSLQARGLAADAARPVLAVNGDFFEIRSGPYQGDPRGLHIQRGELISLATGTAFWVDAGGRPNIGEVTPRARVTWPDGASLAFDVNGPVLTNRATLFTSTFGPSTRATNALEFVLEPAASPDWPPLRANQTFTARVAAIRPGGDTPLATNRRVLAVLAAHSPPARTVKPGDTLTLTTALTPDLAAAPTAIGGWPILVSRDPAREWRPRPGRDDPRHPRTAVGFNDRHLFLVVVDGRQPRLSAGMSFVELATLMRELGCFEALNLDGGGSSTFWLEDRVRNSPSDILPRSVANALVLLREAE